MMLCASRQCKSCQRYGMYCKAQCPKNTNIVPISLNPLENIEELPIKDLPAAPTGRICRAHTRCQVIKRGLKDTLQAQCPNKNGLIVVAQTKLNGHIGNTSGRLVNGAGFRNSCRDMKEIQVYSNVFKIEATCNNNAGGSNPTSFNLNMRVANVNGVLEFHAC
uniref:Cyanovirin-N domain-containing protein n=1 Tax=Physcomitrium patens TaxID=3218 RepID=A0A2K1JD22_PHYPA|nr:hypothetical protein PHYPA_019695 [Physcomitrium patens]